MKVARWISLILGCLILCDIQTHTEKTNAWDFLIILFRILVPAALVITPLVLEYLERMK